MSLHVKYGPSCNLFCYDLTFAQSDKNIIKMFLPVQLSVSTVVLQLRHLIYLDYISILGKDESGCDEDKLLAVFFLL